MASSLGMFTGPSPHNCLSTGRVPVHSTVQTGACTGGENCSPGISRLYRLGVSHAKKAKKSGDECPPLRASAYAPKFFPEKARDTNFFPEKARDMNIRDVTAMLRI